jgi:predicted nucleic acid-binding protein
LKEYVVDASVAAKWLLPSAGETFVSEANRLADLHVQRKARLKAPDLIWSELGNILWKAVRTARTSRADAHSSLIHFSALVLEIIPAQDLCTPALQIATAYDRAFYDSLYVALALQTNAELVTADERLANALASRFPVTWLGAFHE